MYFRTKESSVDANDRSLLRELANAYAGNRLKPVKGSFDGFADPRPSHKPENNELAKARASTVALELLRAFSGTEAWYENVAAVGRGVDPAASQITAEEGIEDIHAPYRRVDIYLEGEPNPEAEPQRGEQSPQPSGIPDYSDRPRIWEDRYGYLIEHGRKREAEGVAALIFKNTASGGPDNVLYDRLGSFAVPVPVKPPWWDARIAAPIFGRGGYQHDPDQRPEHVRRAFQLMADYQLYLNYLADRKADLKVWDASRMKDVSEIPDGYNIQTRLAYLRFMIDAIGSDAYKLMMMAGS